VKPNVLGLGDGTRFNIEGMGEGMLGELMRVERREDVSEEMWAWEM
jgi:hypothetical protein